ncbi:RNA polymerase II TRANSCRIPTIONAL COACTIVATOR [Salix purpurea]|uniref:RNA polymerase II TRANSCRIPTIONAL COACTIVATOR n=1 Tax=Salix purpurea TaxID=77065 RepID=A0A9Q1AKW9_SALPP|nr:RNA polymerase II TRANSCRIPTIONAL COACTIVATOR [Salix purpurea]
MSGRGGKRAAAAREEEEGGAEDNFAQQQPPAKKYAKPDNSSSDNSDDIVVCEIGRNRRVTVRNWRGKINVDIREFYPKDGNLLPGKKGLLFPFLFVYFFLWCFLGVGSSVIGS